MCSRFLVIAAVVCASYLFTMPHSPAPVEAQQAAAQIDFVDLRAQAAGALKALQQSLDQSV